MTHDQHLTIVLLCYAAFSQSKYPFANQPTDSAVISSWHRGMVRAQHEDFSLYETLHVGVVEFSGVYARGSHWNKICMHCHDLTFSHISLSKQTSFRALLNSAEREQYSNPPRYSRHVKGLNYLKP